MKGPLIKIMSIAVLTPTRNRPHMWEMSSTCLRRQTVGLPKITWIILDNSDPGKPGWEEQVKACTDIKIVYTRIPPGTPLGTLRNMCIEMGLKTDAEYLAWWDDDDYYMPQRFEKQIAALAKAPFAGLAICREMHVFLTKENIMLKVGPYPEHQGTCASFFLRRSYAEKNRFDKKAERGEETSFCQKWKAKTVSLDPFDVLLVVGHDLNTVNKSQVFHNQKQFMATIVNQDNGKNIVRYQWIQSQAVWDLFYKTYLAEDADLLRGPQSGDMSQSDLSAHTVSDSKSAA